MAEIPLSQNKIAIIDNLDYQRVVRLHWYAMVKPNGHTRVAHHHVENGKRVYLYLHRFILDAPRHAEVDHINGNGLDNRKSNLRLCTRIENCRNKRKVWGKSQFKGVTYDKTRSSMKRWVARIRVNKNLIVLGGFSSEILAAKAYDRAVKQHFGEFGCTNKELRRGW